MENTARTNIMVMAPDLPYPVTSGGRMRMASLLQGLASFAEVKLACVGVSPDQKLQEWAQQHGITIATHHPHQHNTFQKVRRRFNMLMRLSNLDYHRTTAQFFSNCYTEWRPQLVWVETPYLLLYAANFAKSTPLIVDYWGTSLGAYRRWKIASGLQRWQEFFNWQLARHGEKKHAASLSHIVTVSDPDAEYFRTLAPNAKIWTIPIGIPYLETEPLDSMPEEQPDLMLMTGDFSYTPNIDAACFFVHEIFPRIKQKHPAAKARFAGRNPAPQVARLASCEGVEITGPVPDLRPHIAQAALYVLPMRLGSGIRSKLFEVFPLKKAIVTTAIGAEGLALEPEKNCLIANSPVDFANACVRLLKNKSLRTQLGLSTAPLAQYYSQTRINHILAGVLEEVKDISPYQHEKQP